MKKKILNITILSVFIIIVLSILNEEEDKKSLLNKNYSHTIAKVISKDFTGKIYGIKYCYYINSKYYTGVKSTPNSENFLDKYFVLKYSKEKNDISEIYLNNEVLDSLKIVNAGFKLKKSKYNVRTGEYEIIDYTNQ